MPGAQRTSIGVVGNDGRIDSSTIEGLPGVVQCIHVTRPYKQVSREWRPENSQVTIAPGVVVGGTAVVVIAGRAPSRASSRSSPPRARCGRRARPRSAAGPSSRAPPRTRSRASAGAASSCSALARTETGCPIVTEAMDDEGRTWWPSTAT
jgi:3-deoxy-7-phosphoheptulonate synthase